MSEMDWRALRDAVERTHPATLADSAEAYGRRVLIFDTAKLLLSWVVECDKCSGFGRLVYPRSTYEDGPGPCPSCDGRGWTPDPATVEKVAKVVYSQYYGPSMSEPRPTAREYGIAEAALLAVLGGEE